MKFAYDRRTAHQAIVAACNKRGMPMTYLSGGEVDAIAQAAEDAAAATKEGPDGFTQYKLDAFIGAIVKGLTPAMERWREHQREAKAHEMAADEIARRLAQSEQTPPPEFVISDKPHVWWHGKASEIAIEGLAPPPMSGPKERLRKAVHAALASGYFLPNVEAFVSVLMRESGGSVNPHDARRLADMLFD